MSWILPSVITLRSLAEMVERVERESGRRGTAVIEILRPDHREIFRLLRHHVEVAHDDVVVGMRQLRKAEFLPSGDRTALACIIGETLPEKGDLRHALGRTAMIEMGGIDPDHAIRRSDQTFECRTLDVELVIGSTARQQDVTDRQDRVS